MKPADCPDRTVLEGFVVGSISGREFARIADHVERCIDCEYTLQQLDHRADPLLSQLRRLSRVEISKSESVPQELIASVQSAGARHGASASLVAEQGYRRLGKLE